MSENSKVIAGNNAANPDHSVMSDSLAFFNEVFQLVPENFRLVPREAQEQSNKNKQKQNNNQKQKSNKGGLSLIDLKEKAQKRI